MIDALQQVMNQLETLPPEEQAELAQTIQQLIDEKTGYTIIYGPHTDEEFEALLDAIGAATSEEECEAILARQPRRLVKREGVSL